MQRIRIRKTTRRGAGRAEQSPLATWANPSATSDVAAVLARITQILEAA